MTNLAKFCNLICLISKTQKPSWQAFFALILSGNKINILVKKLIKFWKKHSQCQFWPILTLHITLKKNHKHLNTGVNSNVWTVFQISLRFHICHFPERYFLQLTILFDCLVFNILPDMKSPAWQFSALLTANGSVYFSSYVLLPHPT